MHFKQKCGTVEFKASSGDFFRSKIWKFLDRSGLSVRDPMSLDHGARLGVA
jgi:hypothetical protein